MKKTKIFYTEGQKIGTCIYIKELEPEPRLDKPLSKRRIVVFKCGRCGREFTSKLDDVKYNRVKSCGCLKMEKDSKRKGPVIIKHGCAGTDSKTPEYQTWQSMKGRCKGLNYHDKKNYFDKGIRVCERWADSFENFLEDMGLRPSDKYSLDRRDSSLGYNPENCHWATVKEQNNNKSSNIIITYDGKTQCLMYWSRELGISYHSLTYRIKNNWPIDRAFTPTKRSKMVEAT